MWTRARYIYQTIVKTPRFFDTATIAESIRSTSFPPDKYRIIFPRKPNKKSMFLDRVKVRMSSPEEFVKMVWEISF